MVPNCRSPWNKLARLWGTKRPEPSSQPARSDAVAPGFPGMPFSCWYHNSSTPPSLPTASIRPMPGMGTRKPRPVSNPSPCASPSRLRRSSQMWILSGSVARSKGWLCSPRPRPCSPPGLGRAGGRLGGAAGGCGFAGGSGLAAGEAASALPFVGSVRSSTKARPVASRATATALLGAQRGAEELGSKRCQHSSLPVEVIRVGSGPSKAPTAKRSSSASAGLDSPAAEIRRTNE